MILKCVTILNHADVARSKKLSENLGIDDGVEEVIHWSKLWIDEEQIVRALEVIDETAGKCITLVLSDDDSYMVKDNLELRNYLDVKFCFYKEESCHCV